VAYHATLKRFTRRASPSPRSFLSSLPLVVHLCPLLLPSYPPSSVQFHPKAVSIYISFFRLQPRHLLYSILLSFSPSFPSRPAYYFSSILRCRSSHGWRLAAESQRTKDTACLHAYNETWQNRRESHVGSTQRGSVAPASLAAKVCTARMYPWGLDQISPMRTVSRML
jgi:hypothetical protein